MAASPPYPGSKCNYAHNIRDWETHRLLAERLKQAQCHWILSSYDIPEMRELFSEHFIVVVQSASGMNAEKNGSRRVLNQEVLITNFAPPKQLITHALAPSMQQTSLALENPAEYSTEKPHGFVLLQSPLK